MPGLMLEFPGCRVDLLTRRVAASEGAVGTLSAIECEILGRLAAAGEEAVSREHLRFEVLGLAPSGPVGVLAEMIRRLRAAVEPEPRKPQHIRTVPGLGYRLVGLKGGFGPPLAGNIQLPGRPLLGREQTLARARSLLKQHAWVGIDGPAGVGCSHLGLELATSLGSGLPAWRVGLWAGIDPGLAVVQALGLGHGPGPRDPWRRVAGELACRGPGCLLLDGVQHLDAQGVQGVDRVRRVAARTRLVLVGSLAQTDLAAPILRLGPIPAQAARILLGGGPGPPLPEADLRVMVEAGGGLPDTLRWLRLLAQHAGRATVPAGLRREPEHARDATLALLWTRLSAADRAALGALSVVPGERGADEAAAIAGDTDLGRIGRLAEQGLLHVVPGVRPAVQLPSALADFARRAVDGGTAERVRQRWADWLLARSGEDVRGGRWARVDRTAQGLLAAAASTPPRTALTALSRVWEAASHTLRPDVLERRCAQIGPSLAGDPRCLAMAGAAARRRGLPAQALLTAAVAHPDCPPWHASGAALDLARLCMARGDTAGAFVQLDLAEQRAAQQPVAIARRRVEIGLERGALHLRLAQPASAEGCLLEAREGALAAGTTAWAARAGVALGRLWMALGRGREADQILLMANDEYRSVRSRWGVCAARLAQGELHLHQDALVRAEDELEAVAAELHRLGSAGGVLRATRSLAQLHALRGATAKAIGMLSKAWSHPGRSKDPELAVQVPQLLGALCALEGELPRARQHLRQALETPPSPERPVARSLAQAWLARIDPHTDPPPPSGDVRLDRTLALLGLVEQDLPLPNDPSAVGELYDPDVRLAGFAADSGLLDGASR